MRVRFAGGPLDGETQEIPHANRFYEVAVDGPARIVDGWMTHIHVLRYELRRVLNAPHDYEARPV